MSCKDVETWTRTARVCISGSIGRAPLALVSDTLPVRPVADPIVDGLPAVQIVVQPELLIVACEVVVDVDDAAVEVRQGPVQERGRAGRRERRRYAIGRKWRDEANFNENAVEKIECSEEEVDDEDGNEGNVDHHLRAILHHELSGESHHGRV